MKKTCGTNKECKKGFDCEIAAGIDLCPDCNGIGKIVAKELILQN